MSQVTEYKKSNGRIFAHHSGRFVFEDFIETEETSYVHGSFSGKTYYVVNGVPELRPAMPGALNKTTIAADKMDTAIISNLPEPCMVTFKDQQYEVTDGSFGFTADLPGTYEVKVEAWPHLDAFFTVEAVE